MGIKSLYYHSKNNTVHVIIIIVNRYKIYCCYQQSNNNYYTVRKNFEKHATAANLHTLGDGDGDRKIKHRS